MQMEFSDDFLAGVFSTQNTFSYTDEGENNYILC